MCVGFYQLGRNCMNLGSIKLIVSEVDGIITEHLVAIGEMNTVMFKQFYMKDFEAINLIKKDFGFVFLSSDASISMSLCKKRNIPFFFAERNKKEVLSNVLLKYSITPDEVLYIGSSFSDIDCIKLSGTSMCPEDSVSQVKNLVNHVIPVYSGTGVISYVHEILYSFNINKERGE
jgi:3-deoxy-D-manno-octulosonate 8-phosphate phosphatase (KDO 8-P phosphatase)